MIDNVSIRRVTTEDLHQLQHISRQTFIEAFAPDNTEENMNLYMDESFSIEKLSTELRDPCSAFYFATLGAAVIGYLKLNFGQSQTDLKDDTALEIERIYVLKEYYGRKIAQLLYEKALEIAARKNLHYIWLGVWEHNHRAIAFYKKNGFTAFGQHAFMLGTDRQTDIMMKKQITAEKCSA